MYIYAAVSNGNWKPRWFALIRLPFALPTNGSLSFVHLFTKKQTEVIRLQMDLTDLLMYDINSDTNIILLQ